MSNRPTMVLTIHGPLIPKGHQLNIETKIRRPIAAQHVGATPGVSEACRTSGVRPEEKPRNDQVASAARYCSGNRAERIFAKRLNERLAVKSFCFCFSMRGVTSAATRFASQLRI